LRRKQGGFSEFVDTSLKIFSQRRTEIVFIEISPRQDYDFHRGGALGTSGMRSPFFIEQRGKYYRRRFKTVSSRKTRGASLLGDLSLSKL